jgi:hypothetical protein
MQLTQRLPWIVTAMIASLAAVVSGVHAGQPWLSWVSVALFALSLVSVGIEINRDWWGARSNERTSETPIDDASYAALQNAQLMVLAYMWGALAMIAVYRLTGLRWQHGMQYGVGMALIATFYLMYAWLIAIPDSSLRTRRALQGATFLVLAHGAAALGGIMFLVLSGKILSTKADWAANQIFTAGGLAIATLSFIGALTSLRLMCKQDQPREPAPEARNVGFHSSES